MATQPASDLYRPANVAVLSRPAGHSTQTMSISAASSCNVEANAPDMTVSPFDKLHAAEAARSAAWTKARTKRTPRQKAPRLELFKRPVKVPTEVGNYRAELCAWARWLQPHLASVMIGAVCASDVGGEPASTSHEAISAYTHTPGIQQRYNCQPVSPFQVEYNLPTLATMGLVTTSSRKYYDAWDRRFKTEFLLTISDENISNLEALYSQEKAAKAARDAEKADRKAASADRRNRYKREERARQTVVELEGSNSRHTADTGSGTESGTESGTGHIANASQIVPNKIAKATSSSSRADARDDEEASPSAEDRGGQAPHTPEDTAEYAYQVRKWLARLLGVSPGEVGWNAVELANDLALQYSQAAVVAAAQRATYQTGTSVGYFVTSAESQCARFAAEQQHREQAEQARTEQTRLADEIDSWQPRFEAVRVSANFFRGQIKHWRDQGLTDEQILARLPKWLSQRTAKHAEWVAGQAEAEREREETVRIRDEYADRFHGGNRLAAGRYVYDQTGAERGPRMYDFMREALASEGETK